MPYLQTALADSISIVWRTSSAGHCAVAYKKRAAAEWQQLKGVTHNKRFGGVENLVTIKGLEAGSEYQYRIFTDGHELAQEKAFSFRAPKEASAPFTFYAAGDIGEPVKDEGKPDKMAQQISRLATAPDFGLLLGDIIYPNGESEGYDQHLFNYFADVFSRIPTFALLGNHEWNVNPEVNFIQEWKLPGNEHYYSFDRGNTHFIALDSKKGQFYDYEKQKEWLINDLKQAKAKGYQWLVVLLHYNGKSCTYKPDTERVIELYPLFAEYGVDLVLNGHAHTYERLNPMNGEGVVLYELIGKHKEYQDVAGFISITVGSGGKLRGVGTDPTPFKPNPKRCKHPNLVAVSSHDWAFLRVEVDGNKLQAEAISSLNGEVLDSFSITKSGVAHDSLHELRINQLQLIGSHNSYKQAIDPRLHRLIAQKDSAAASALDYSHISPTEQLDMGLLNLEIDVLADTDGGRYAKPLGFNMIGDEQGLQQWDPEGLMLKPSFKVLHVQEIDFKSHYKTFAQCLQDLKQWSDANPDHYPVFITVNAKEGASRIAGGVAAEKFTAEVFDLLDQELVKYLGKSKLLTPDEVRGKYTSLREAVLAQNWPRVKDARGKFVFILDEHDAKREIYRAKHPSLKGRMMFVNAEPESPEAAILIMNNPKSQLDQIQEMVRKGYIVRTRADANTAEARRNDKSRFRAAQESGAQIITTDYYLPSTHFNSPYQISFRGNTYVRPNPLNVK
ncbi:hypothetical protein D770_10240 [Flammeovirgaceae bacterium 311]|nr:hypothetical protein D770_10240 [Flammeovirgaceae bacterium 311]